MTELDRTNECEVKRAINEKEGGGWQPKTTKKKKRLKVEIREW